MARNRFGMTAADFFVSFDSQPPHAVFALPGQGITLWDAATSGTEVTTSCIDLAAAALPSPVSASEWALLQEFDGPNDDSVVLWADGGLGAPRVKLVSVWVPGSVPDATETVKGKAEIATQAETDAGTDDTRIVTAKKLNATTLFLKGISNAVQLLGTDGTVGDFTVKNDGTSNTGWPRRLRILYDAVVSPGTPNPIESFVLDKFGQARAYATAAAQVPLRAVNKSTTPTSNLFEVGVNDTSPGLGGFTIKGWVYAPNVDLRVSSLEVGDPTPSPAAGTPATLYVRKLA